MIETPKNRLVALDVFRGATIAGMILVNTPGSWDHVYAPLLHKKWEGCSFTDLIFPSFLFIIGVSMWYSFRKYPSGQKASLIGKIVKRSAMIFIIGLLLTWFPFHHLNLDELRFAGVLQRIAICYLFAAFVCAYVREKWILLIAAALLLIYWAWIESLFGEQGIARDAVFQSGIDLVSLRSCISSSVPILVGYLIGSLIDKRGSLMGSVLILLAIGSGMIVIGQLWGEVFPIVKSLLWSSSYVLYSSGVAVVTFAICLWGFDQGRLKQLAFPFMVFGLNPLFIYAVSILVDKLTWIIKIGDDVSLHQWIYSNVFVGMASPVNASLIYGLCFVVLNWLIAYWLYRRRVIIKV